MKNASQKVETDEIQAVRALFVIYTCVTTLHLLQFCARFTWKMHSFSANQMRETENVAVHWKNVHSIVWNT